MDKIKVVVPLHGIRTIASWQRTLSDAVQNVGWKCALDKWNYGIFSLFRFLIPRQRESRVSWFRSTYTEFTNDRTFEIDNSNLPSIVAHSFGTYILGYSLLKYNNVRFDKVILCGSILPEDFPWRDILARGQVNAVRNEFGTNDFWSNIVRWFVQGTGASGKKGFWYQHPRLFQQEFLFQHSEYFERGHMDEYWIPFIRKEIAVEGVARELPVHRPRPNIPWGLYGLYLIIAATASIYVIPWRQLTDVTQIAALQSQLATATTQNTTLQSKLETVQQERDRAIVERNSTQTNLAADRKTIETIRSQLQAAHTELADTKRQLQVAQEVAHMPPPPPPPEDQIPIRWQPDFQLLWGVSGVGQGDVQMSAFRFSGEATSLAQIKDAYVISNLTGQKQHLQVLQIYDNEHIPSERIEAIPSGAVIYLIDEWKPPLPLKDFLSQWGDIQFNVLYDDGRKYPRTYDRDYIEQKLTRELAGLYGPRVTKKSTGK
jgi:hypothetical protein